MGNDASLRTMRGERKGNKKKVSKKELKKESWWW
jgi:hypothetical protein